MINNFNNCLKITLSYEGGYSNHPKDPGGSTNRGITQTTYNIWRDKAGLPRRDIRLITQTEIERIYKYYFWDPVKGDALIMGLDLSIFDFCVNSGQVQASKTLQRIINIPADGIIGTDTLWNVNSKDPGLLIEAIAKKRLDFLRSLSTWKTFGNGWTERVNGIRTYSLKMLLV